MEIKQMAGFDSSDIQLLKVSRTVAVDVFVEQRRIQTQFKYLRWSILQNWKKFYIDVEQGCASLKHTITGW